MSINTSAKIIGKTIEYKEGQTVLEGYVAFDDAIKTSRPGILIVHDWLGITDFTKEKADELARLGYLAFAADIYGKGVRPNNPKEAGELAGKYKADINLLRARIIAAHQEMLKQDVVDKNKTAVIGFCFGGTTALELARSGTNIKGAVSFHGGLATSNPKDAKNIKAKILVLHGADDPFVPEKEVAGFESEMRAAGLDWQLVKYSNSVHSFTNPNAGTDNSKGAAYNPLAAKRSWQAMQMFFHEIFL
jgi:dienelactone hydrolase